MFNYLASLMWRRPFPGLRRTRARGASWRADAPGFRRRPALERLEDRTVPSGTTLEQITTLSVEADNLVSQATTADQRLHFLEGQLTGTGPGSGAGSPFGSAGGTVLHEVTTLTNETDGLVSQIATIDRQLHDLQGQLISAGAASGSGTVLGQVTTMAGEADNLFNLAETMDQRLHFLEGELSVQGQGSGSGSSSGQHSGSGSSGGPTASPLNGMVRLISPGITGNRYEFSLINLTNTPIAAPMSMTLYNMPPGVGVAGVTSAGGTYTVRIPGSLPARGGTSFSLTFEKPLQTYLGGGTHFRFGYTLSGVLPGSGSGGGSGSGSSSGQTSGSGGPDILPQVRTLVAEADQFLSGAEQLDQQLHLLEGQLTNSGSGSGSGSGQGSTSGSGSSGGSPAQQVGTLAGEADGLVNLVETIDQQLQFLNGQLTGFGQGSGAGSSGGSFAQQVATTAGEADNAVSQAEALDQQLHSLQGQFAATGQGNGALAQEVAALVSATDGVVSQAGAVDQQLHFVQGQLAGSGSGSGSTSGSASGSASFPQEVTALAGGADDLVSDADALDRQLHFLQGQLNPLA